MRCSEGRVANAVTAGAVWPGDARVITSVAADDDVCVLVLWTLVWAWVWLASQASAETLPIINEVKRRSKGVSYVNSGVLQVASFSITPRPSFLDYIAGGCELNFMVRGLGVDWVVSGVQCGERGVGLSL